MDELKNIAPELSKMKKDKPFGTPNHYFDDFTARMQMKLEEEKAVADNKEFKIIRLLKPVLGLAASFAVIFMLVYVPLKTFVSTDDKLVEQTVSADYSEGDFQQLLEELDENTFFSLLESKDIEDSFSDEDLMAYVSTNFNSYEIYHYTEN